jgi:7,8-didemethyl-8-hydroxy-5-deazariboflavin synthase CofG subunit
LYHERWISGAAAVSAMIPSIGNLRLSSRFWRSQGAGNQMLGRTQDDGLSVREKCADVVELPSEPLSREHAYRWICAGYDELPELLAVARAARDRFKPGLITYSRKVFIPLTNLCRDYCGYCTFRRDPGQPGAHTMSPDEVLRVAREGEKLGCTEALFSLGDKPELIFPEMRETLRKLGYRSTLHYLEAMCGLVLRETSLLPHPNPGLMSAEWIARLARVSPSMGLMLETTNDALLAPGAAHDNAPDKLPAKRLRTLEEAGKQNVPFTTGILIGIGESAEDRVDALIAIRDLHRRYGHIQEVIIQNFRSKPEIPMANWPEPNRGEMLRTIAVARLLMPDVNLQAPPNLSDPDYAQLLDAGINDWGGVSPLTPDFINPERPWPHLKELERRTLAKGFQLRQRLPVYPEFVERAAAKGSLLSQKLAQIADSERYARRAA